MKKTILILLILASFGTAKAQPVDANTPILLAIEGIQTQALAVNAIVQGTLAKLEILEKLKTATDFVDDLNSLKQIAQLLNDFVCQTDYIKVLYKASYSSNSCLINLEYNMSIVNLQFSTDIIKYAFLSKNLLTMEAAQRTSMLQGVIEALQKSMEQMSSLKSKLEKGLNQQILNTYFEKRMKENAKSVSYSRYGS